MPCVKKDIAKRNVRHPHAGMLHRAETVAVLGACRRCRDLATEPVNPFATTIRSRRQNMPEKKNTIGNITKNRVVLLLIRSKRILLAHNDFNVMLSKC